MYIWNIYYLGQYSMKCSCATRFIPSSCCEEADISLINVSSPSVPALMSISHSEMCADGGLTVSFVLPRLLLTCIGVTSSSRILFLCEGISAWFSSCFTVSVDLSVGVFSTSSTVFSDFLSNVLPFF